MSKKRRIRRGGINRFRFVSALTPDAALERLHDLSPVETHVRQSYQVKSEKLDDTIYFEMEVKGGAYGLPPMPGPIIRGQIRAIDANRTLVEGDLKYPPQLKFFGLLFTTVFGGGSIWAFLTGSMPAGDLLTLVGLVLVTILIILVFGTAEGGRNLTIDRIEQHVRPLWNDLIPDYHRESRRLIDRSEQHADDFAADEYALVQKPQDDAQAGT